MKDAVATMTFDAFPGSGERLEREPVPRERLSAVSRLTAVIAREVRSPLVTIRGSVRALRVEGLRPEDVREAAADIDRELARLDRIVRSALEVARPVRVELAPVDLPALVWDAAGSILGGWEGPHVRLALEPDLGTVVTDAGRLRGVLACVLENAREAVRAAGRSAGVDGIEIGACRVAGCRLRLWVEDRGAGVAAADLPHVFEPFFTTRTTGTGLGLAIARRVVEALGGTIRMDSREGEGTRVEIDLPANAALTPAA
jgi:signal transduction histidine kinase